MGDPAYGMDDKRRDDDPKRLEDQEQFGRDHNIGNEEAVRDAREHLRPRQGHEAGVALESAHCASVAVEWMPATMLDAPNSLRIIYTVLAYALPAALMVTNPDLMSQEEPAA